MIRAAHPAVQLFINESTMIAIKMTVVHFGRRTVDAQLTLNCPVARRKKGRTMEHNQAPIRSLMYTYVLDVHQHKRGRWCSALPNRSRRRCRHDFLSSALLSFLYSVFKYFPLSAYTSVIPPPPLLLPVPSLWRVVMPYVLTFLFLDNLHCCKGYVFFSRLGYVGSGWLG